MENSVVIVGNGFIGNRVAWSINGSKVFHIGHTDPETDIKNLPLEASYIVVWCHGVSRGSAAEIIDSQLGFMVRVIRLLESLSVNVAQHIFLSSTHVYLDSTFGYAKRLCEAVILLQASVTEADTCVIRVPNVYGAFSEEKPNSILSRWLCGDSQVRADASARVDYVSVQQVADTVISQLNTGSGIIDMHPGEPLPIRDIGAEIAEIRGLAFEISEFEQPTRAEVPPTAPSSECAVPSLEITSISMLVRGCGFAKELRSRVRQSQRSHNSPCGERVLLDLEAEDLKHLERVYVFNVAKGTKRGGHYHKEQIETFTVVKGHCELQITNADGDTSPVALSAGQKITVYPGEEHTFWSPHFECMVLTTSNMPYIPNSVPDTYTY